MERDWTPLIVPLGRRLLEMAERISRSRRAQPEWLAASTAVRAQIAALAGLGVSRFERLEVAPRRLDSKLTVTEETPLYEEEGEAGEPLPPAVRKRLRSQVGAAADVMRVHVGEASHRIAVAHRADAVATGPDVHFRRGRYQPHDEEGFALLAHEAAHVSHSMLPNAGWQRPMMAELQAQEAVAIAVERDVRHRISPARDRAARAPAASPSVDRAAPAPVAPASRPMTAAVDRALDMAPPPAPLDLERLRQTLARDLIRQIKAELERGG
jgi:uncharacterized protein DUF4157